MDLQEELNEHIKKGHKACLQIQGYKRKLFSVEAFVRMYEEEAKQQLKEYVDKLATCLLEFRSDMLLQLDTSKKSKFEQIAKLRHGYGEQIDTFHKLSEEAEKYLSFNAYLSTKKDRDDVCRLIQEMKLLLADKDEKKLDDILHLKFKPTIPPETISAQYFGKVEYSVNGETDAQKLKQAASATEAENDTSSAQRDQARPLSSDELLMQLLFGEPRLLQTNNHNTNHLDSGEPTLRQYGAQTGLSLPSIGQQASLCYPNFQSLFSPLPCSPFNTQLTPEAMLAFGIPTAEYTSQTGNQQFSLNTGNQQYNSNNGNQQCTSHTGNQQRLSNAGKQQCTSNAGNQQCTSNSDNQPCSSDQGKHKCTSNSEKQQHSSILDFSMYTSPLINQHEKIQCDPQSDNEENTSQSRNKQFASKARNKLGNLQHTYESKNRKENLHSTFQPGFPRYNKQSENPQHTSHLGHKQCTSQTASQPNYPQYTSQSDNHLCSFKSRDVLEDVFNTFDEEDEKQKEKPGMNTDSRFKTGSSTTTTESWDDELDQVSLDQHADLESLESVYYDSEVTYKTMSPRSKQRKVKLRLPKMITKSLNGDSNNNTEISLQGINDVETNREESFEERDVSNQNPTFSASKPSRRSSLVSKTDHGLGKIATVRDENNNPLETHHHSFDKVIGLKQDDDAIVDASSRCEARQVAGRNSSSSELTGSFLRTISIGLKYPLGVTTDRDGRIIVTDSGNDLVKIYNADGSKILTLGPRLRPPLRRPSAVVVNEYNEIFVKDNQCIYKFSSDGRILRHIGQHSLSRPFGLDLTPVKDLITLDLKHRHPTLKHFSQDGGYCSSYLYTPLINADPRSKCRFMAVSDKTVLVSDLGLSQIYLTNLEGGYIGVFGSHGVGPDQFIEPSGISVDTYGNTLIADSKNNRIKIYKENSCYCGDVKLDWSVDRPSGIHRTWDNKLVVANFLLHKIDIYQLKETLTNQKNKD